MSEANQRLRSQITLLTRENHACQAKIARLEEESSGLRMTKKPEEQSRRELDRRRELSDSLQKQVYSLTAGLRQMEAQACDAENKLVEKAAEVQALNDSQGSRRYEVQNLRQNQSQWLPTVRYRNSTILEFENQLSSVHEEGDQLKEQSVKSETKYQTIVQKLTAKSRESEGFEKTSRKRNSSTKEQIAA
jgi:chromosome segregation ATPase